MLLAKDFRRYAREALKGRWIKAGAVALVAALLGASIQGGAGSVSVGSMAQSGEQTAENAMVAMPAEVMMLILGIGLVGMVYALIIFVIGGATTLGYAKYNLNLVDDKNPQIRDIFSQYDRLWQGFVLQFLRALYTSLWSLLFVIPGIIASFRYSMAAYILYENPEMTANEAITESKKLMVGNKWRLFCLNFSFFGWILLAGFGIYVFVLMLAPLIFLAGTFNTMMLAVMIVCVLACICVYSLLLEPYMEASVAVFYREIRYGKYSNPVVDTQEQFTETIEETQY